MTNEMQKRIEEAAYSYDIPRHFNCYGCCQSDSDYEKAFKAGAKFILELTEFDMIKSFLSFASIENASQREVSFHAKELLEALKKAGLCE